MQKECSHDDRFILQVWDQKGEITYQTTLSQRPVSWFITFNTFVFKPHDDDQEDGHDYYHIVFLHRGNSKVKIDVKG